MSSRTDIGREDVPAKEQLKDRIDELEEIVDESEGYVATVYQSVLTNLREEMEGQS